MIMMCMDRKVTAYGKNNPQSQFVDFIRFFFSFGKMTSFGKQAFLCFSKMKECMFEPFTQFHWACGIIRIPLGQGLTLGTEKRRKKML